MNPAITNRRAVLDDAPALARVHIEAWRTAYRGIMPVEETIRIGDLDLVHVAYRWPRMNTVK